MSDYENYWAEEGCNQQEMGWAIQEMEADIHKEKDLITYNGKTLTKLSYLDLSKMGIPDETLDRQLFGSDYDYYQDEETKDVYQFEGDHFMGHWTEMIFKSWFCED